MRALDRGGEGGHSGVLARGAMRGLRTYGGFTHALTLADDDGSGKLREWYARLGFVAVPELASLGFGQTAMVAATPPQGASTLESARGAGRASDVSDT